MHEIRGALISGDDNIEDAKVVKIKKKKTTTEWTF